MFIIRIVAIIAASIVIVPALLLFLLHSVILDWQGKIKDPGNPLSASPYPHSRQ